MGYWPKNIKYGSCDHLLFSIGGENQPTATYVLSLITDDVSKNSCRIMVHRK